jgi:hypothetical protein
MARDRVWCCWGEVAGGKHSPHSQPSVSRAALGALEVGADVLEVDVCCCSSKAAATDLDTHTTTMGRKGETTKFKGAKAAPSKAAKKERERKKRRDSEDEKDAERLGARARLNRSRPECPVCFDEVATHKLLPCSHSYCLEHAQQCLQRGSCAICRQAPRFHQPLLNLADFSPAERRFLSS